MLKNFVPRERVTEVSYSLQYFYDCNGGFSFPCDKDGNVLPGLTDAALKNLCECREHPERFEYPGEVVKEVHRYTENAHGTCDCGREVYLYDEYMGACECECGRWYNLFGQELKPPCAWEEAFDDE